MATWRTSLDATGSGAMSPFSRLQRICPDRCEGALRAAALLLAGRPLGELLPAWQAEIHLGRCCDCHCDHCLGTYLRKPVPPQPSELVLSLVRRLKENGVSRIALSGIFTDPLCYDALPEVLACIHEQGLPLGFHTKLLSASRSLLWTLGATRAEGSYVSISLDYFDARLYETHLRPRVAGGFGQARANVEELCAAVHAMASPLHVDLRTLVMRDTCIEHLDAYASWYRSLRARWPLCCIHWRLSVPWLPTDTPAGRRLPRESRLRPPAYCEGPLAEWVVGLIGRSQKFPGRGEVYFRHNDLSAEGCAICVNQFLYAAIGADGGFYPCQGIASPQYAGLAYGNLYAGDDFFACWHARTRDQLLFRPGVQCPCCAAPTEAEVNRAAFQERPPETTQTASLGSRPLLTNEGHRWPLGRAVRTARTLAQATPVRA